MNRSDHAIIGGLVVVLALIALAIGLPSMGQGGLASPSPSPVVPAQSAYREGVLGRPVSINPLGARTQVDRDLVALAFSGLVKLGPNGMLVPDLASRWSVDPTAKTWTFNLRPDATWHDGAPLTSADVVFTIGILKDPTYTGPGAGSWREVTVTAIDANTVRFDLATPLGGFLELATQPIAPQHLLGQVAIEQLSTDPFGRNPIGSGPFAIVELDDNHAVLEPAGIAARPAVETADPGGVTPSRTVDPFATPSVTKRPSVAQPYLSRLEFRFFDNAATVADSFRRGELDAVSGLTGPEATDLSSMNGARLMQYPGTTLTTIILNLRPDHVELRDPRVRTALLEAIDRPGLIGAVFGGRGVQADAPIPPSSWAFDATASAPLAHDVNAAAAALAKAGWKKVDGSWRPAGAKAAYELELLSPERTLNPVLYAVANRVAADWEAAGIKAKIVETDPGSPIVGYLQEGHFAAAVIDVAIGHDPDLYPLLASSQTQTGGLNVIGLQDATLDPLLDAARRPGTDAVRRAAYRALQVQLAKARYVLPVAFADEVVVVRNTLSGPSIQAIADPSDRFWDVLTWRLANGR